MRMPPISTSLPNKYNSVTFRFNMYAMRDGAPAENLLAKDVIFEVNGGYRGWYKIDMVQQSLFLEQGKEVMISIAIVDERVAEGARFFLLNASFSPNTGIYRRSNVAGDWDRVNGTLGFYLDVTTYGSL